MITVEQLKTARLLVRWSQLTLALEASVDLKAVSTFEAGKKGMSELVSMKIKNALQHAGIEFCEGKSVRLRKR